jgi:cytochrome c oxidase assembly protein subunit 15
MKVTPLAFRRITTIAVICFALLVVTGGAVRLTGSGLGCPDWPLCYAHRATAAVSFHPLVEFSNRVVTVAVTIISVAAFVAALARVPRRRDLLVWSGSLVGGILGQIVLGGLVVHFTLNPYLVALHFLLTLVILAGALVLRHRASTSETEAVAIVGPEMLWLSRLLVGILCVLVTAGTIVSGSGPHAGGVGAKRIDVAFRDVAELHSTIALFLIGCTLATLFALHQAHAPDTVQRRARLLFEIIVLQGTLGFTQYFLHDAPVVVEFHLAGATAAWCAAITYYLALHRHPEMDETALLLRDRATVTNDSVSHVTELTSRI